MSPPLLEKVKSGWHLDKDMVQQVQELNEELEHSSKDRFKFWAMS